MVSRKLMVVWGALDFLLLAAGAVAIALSVVWRQPNILMNMVLSDKELTGAHIRRTSAHATCTKRSTVQPEPSSESHC